MLCHRLPFIRNNSPEKSFILRYTLIYTERERGDNGLFNTLVPKVSYSLVYQLWRLDWILIGWFIKLIFETFKLLILMYRWGNFVYHHWGCTSIYRPFSYPFRSLRNTIYFINRLAASPLAFRGVAPRSFNKPIFL